MTYNAIVKLCYINDTEASHNKYFPEIVDKQTITIEAPAQDLNTHQYFELFKSFLRAVGFDEYNIMEAACRIAFNDSNDEAKMKKVADEYELILEEDYRKKLVEYDKQQDEEIKKLEAEIRELKEKLGEVLPELYGKGVTKDVLENAYTVCKDCGKKYGEYSVGCSSVWEGECDVCGETKPVTEKRDYGYLEKGIKELSKAK
jgi:DNA repair exonuclease SbcCD ATPase subunit